MFSNNSDFFVLIAFMLVQSLVLYLNTRRVENRITAELSAIKRSRQNSSANTELLQKINDLDRNISLMGYEVRDIKNGVGSRDSNSGSGLIEHLKITPAIFKLSGKISIASSKK